MKILFTGGGSGGHFYPIIAIVQEINAIVQQEKYVEPKYYYMSDNPYDEKVLFEYNITFIHAPAGKLRIYFSPKNIFDGFRTFYGICVALVKLFILFPDVVVCKGGYAAFPPVFAARILRIPVVIHESDSIPGRVNIFAGKFAKRVGIAYEEAANFFKKNLTALVGVPIRRELVTPMRVGAHEFLKLDKTVPVIMVLGGSQGAQNINDIVVDILPELLKSYQVIHQVGSLNIAGIKDRLNIVLGTTEHKERYKMFGFLNNTALAMSAGVSSLVITRAGSTLIFEIAGWGLPSIVIPIPRDVSRDQQRNALNFARSGASVLLEESNLTPHILLSEIDRIMTSPDIQKQMSERARAFARPEAARKMAEVILSLVLSHER